jgi:hypothetical protein
MPVARVETHSVRRRTLALVGDLLSDVCPENFVSSSDFDGAFGYWKAQHEGGHAIS